MSLKGLHSENILRGIASAAAGLVLLALGVWAVSSWRQEKGERTGPVERVGTAGPQTPPPRLQEDPITSLAFAPDGRTVATGSRQETLVVWDAASGKSRTVLTKAHGRVRPYFPGIDSLAFAPDGKTVA